VADRIIDNPIINSPYRVPEQYFRFDDKGIHQREGAGAAAEPVFYPGAAAAQSAASRSSLNSPSSPRTRSGRTTSSTRSVTESTSGVSSGIRTSRPHPPPA